MDPKNVARIPSGSLHEEYGNALSQDIKTVSPSDSDVTDVIKYVQQYARERYPWSIPRSSSQGPDPLVTKLSKKKIIYTHDGEIPLYVVQDRFDNEQDITRCKALGTVYDFVLTWTESMIKFCHTFTVSVYPKDRINIYTHTYFLQNLNISHPNIGQSQYLFPKIVSGSSSYHTEQFTYISEFPYSDTYKGSFHQPYTDKPDSCSGQLEGGDGDKVLFTDKTGEYRLVKVMTYNIWNMNSNSTRVGGYTERMKRLKETILKSDPDIVALQEVRFEEAKGEDLGPSQIHTLSEWLPQYQYVFQPAQMQSSTVNDGLSEEGVAIMSKYPVISYNSIMLFINRSNSADIYQRVLLQADIFIPSVGMLHVFNTHLSLSHEAREKSVVQIWNHVKLQKGPAIVLGDLNAEPNEPSMQYLSGNSVFPGEDRSQLIDAWSASSPGDNGLTFSAMDKNFTKRIDYIFFRQGDQCCRIESCNVIDDGSKGSEAASDHLPVMVVLSMKTKGKHSTDSC